MRINVGSKRLQLDYKFNIRKNIFGRLKLKRVKIRKLQEKILLRLTCIPYPLILIVDFLQYVVVGILTYMIETFGYLRMLIQIFLLPYCKLSMKN